MTRSDDERETATRDRIVQVVVKLLESKGYEGVQLRTVAKRARVSLATIYKFFSTRDELIVAALERWMAAHAYSDRAVPPPDASLYDGLMWGLRHVFEPWEHNPRMLDAYHHAATGPGGDHLLAQGMAAVEPVARPFLARIDPAYADDIMVILAQVVYAVIGQFADGAIGITEILPILERTVFRLTSDNAAPAAAGHRGHAARRRRATAPD